MVNAETNTRSDASVGNIEKPEANQKPTISASVMEKQKIGGDISPDIRAVINLKIFEKNNKRRSPR